MNMFTVNCKINGHLSLSGIFKQMPEYPEYTDDDIYLICLMVYILIVTVIVSLIFYFIISRLENKQKELQENTNLTAIERQRLDLKLETIKQASCYMSIIVTVISLIFGSDLFPNERTKEVHTDMTFILIPLLCGLISSILSGVETMEDNNIKNTSMSPKERNRSELRLRIAKGGKHLVWILGIILLMLNVIETILN